MFGAGAYKDDKKIMLIVDLVSWDDHDDVDRLGLDVDTETYFNTAIPNVKIPITAARSVPTLIEVAAMNARLRHMGIHMAETFSQSLSEIIKNNSTIKNNSKK